MSIIDREWRVIDEAARPGAVQMALDEVAALTASEGGPATARVYRWDPATVSLGYSQSVDVLDRSYCDRHGIDVTRRPTGGGTIYHDGTGDIAYSVVLPASAVPGDLTESYRLLCEPLFDALDRVGVDARFADKPRPAVFDPACYLRAMHPAHDVVGPDGRKLAGNAQYRTREAVVQHGSLSFSRATATHLSVFDDAPVDAETFEDRVGAVTEYVDCTREQAVAALADALADWTGGDAGEWTGPEREAARERADRKFAADAWIEDREATLDA